jgi:23S rRNA pseudouridine1911/1915/1917 synthase
MRLDQFLAEVSELSRSQITQRIEAGDVTVDGHIPTKGGLRVRGGELVELRIPPPPPSDAIPQDIPFDVVYEDDELVVVDKPSDLVVHPSPGHETGTMVNALLYRYGTLAPDVGTEDGRPRPGIVHRLDLGTSGLMLVARTLKARVALSEQIAARNVSRRYLALVHGTKLPDAGVFDTLHGRHPKDRKRFSSRVRHGKVAVTHYRVIARGTTMSLVECALETGRTHQIRVHFSDAGYPLVGDRAYGGRRRTSGRGAASASRLERQALHAWAIKFRHPTSSQELAFHQYPPLDMAEVIYAVFGRPVEDLVSVNDAFESRDTSAE